MDNAVCAVKQDGAVILFAECVEGSGSQVLEETCKRLGSPGCYQSRIREELPNRSEQSFAVTRLMKKAKFYLVSSLDRKMAREMLFEGAFDTFEEALAAAEVKIGRNGKVILMPEGSLTVLRLEEK